MTTAILQQEIDEHNWNVLAKLDDMGTATAAELAHAAGVELDIVKCIIARNLVPADEIEEVAELVFGAWVELVEDGPDDEFRYRAGGTPVFPVGRRGH